MAKERQRPDLGLIIWAGIYEAHGNWEPEFVQRWTTKVCGRVPHYKLGCAWSEQAYKPRRVAAAVDMRTE